MSLSLHQDIVLMRRSYSRGWSLESSDSLNMLGKLAHNNTRIQHIRVQVGSNFIDLLGVGVVQDTSMCIQHADQIVKRIRYCEKDFHVTYVRHTASSFRRWDDNRSNKLFTTLYFLPNYVTCTGHLSLRFIENRKLNLCLLWSEVEGRLVILQQFENVLPPSLSLLHLTLIL